MYHHPTIDLCLHRCVWIRYSPTPQYHSNRNCRPVCTHKISGTPRNLRTHELRFSASCRQSHAYLALDRRPTQEHSRLYRSSLTNRDVAENYINSLPSFDLDQHAQPNSTLTKPPHKEPRRLSLPKRTLDVDSCLRSPSTGPSLHLSFNQRKPLCGTLTQTSSNDQFPSRSSVAHTCTCPRLSQPAKQLHCDHSPIGFGRLFGLSLPQ